MPFKELPVFNSMGVNAKTRYVPQMYAIEGNAVRDALIRNQGRYSLPENEAPTLTVREKNERRAERFDSDPLYYMALGHEMVLGITVRDMRYASNRFEESMLPDGGTKRIKGHGRKMTEMLKSAVIRLKTCYQESFERDFLPPYDMNSVFPEVKITVCRNQETDDYHKNPKQTVVTRLIPVYVLPFLVAQTQFREQPVTVGLLDNFIRWLEMHQREHPILAHYDDSYLQMRANFYRLFRDVGTTAETVRKTRDTYMKEREATSVRIEKLSDRCRDRNREANRRIESLERTVREWELRLQRVEASPSVHEDGNRKRKRLYLPHTQKKP